MIALGTRGPGPESVLAAANKSRTRVGRCQGSVDSAREFSLLKLLAGCEGQVVSRETILNKVWDYEKFPTTRTIDTFMDNLRRKIEDDPKEPKHLVTVPWLGYKFQR